MDLFIKLSCPVSVDIYDGNYLVVSLEVDQKSDGGQWNVLGEYEFNGTARVVIRSSGNCSTSVDSLRFVRTGISRLDVLESIS